MGRWGLREIATLCVLVWVMAACGPMLPAPSLTPPPSYEATLILRTVSPPPATPRTPGFATLAPITRTPRIEWTPAPSATPFYYVVVAGDTLDQIAARFGIDPRTLQEANEDLPADIIYPGQVLLIPQTASAFISASASFEASGTFVRFLPTNTPLPFPLTAPTCYTTPANEALCLGWVANTLDTALTGITVQVSLYDLGDVLLAQRAVSAAQQRVPAGDGVPYAVRFPDAPAFAYAEAVLLSAETLVSAPTSSSPDVRSLDLLDHHLMTEDGLIRIQGVFQNEGDQPLQAILIAATLFDEAGRVAGFRIQHREGPLNPGETLAVDVLITPLAEGTVRYVLYAEGSPVPAGP